MKLSGAQIVLNRLKAQGVKEIFGYPGGAVIPLYDALYDEMDYFEHYRTAHEQAAVHAADAYSRTTGEVGVAIVTSGPGATNTITGIATAYLDSVPLVVISGQVPSVLLGKDSFQEMDITGITLPITKHNYLVRDLCDLGSIIDEAFEIASSGRPGPVLVDIPKDLFVKKIDFEPKNGSNVEVQYDQPAQTKLEEIAQKINQAKRPVIHAGGGVIISETSDLLYKLATKAEIPVVNTLMGLGSFPRDHRLSLGMLGMHGFAEANLAVTNCDLVLAVGARFSDRVIGNPSEFAMGAEVIHLDVDRSEISKNIDASLSLIGDLKVNMEILLGMIEDADRSEWVDQIYSYKEAEPDMSEFVPENILKRISQVAGGNAVVATDVGQHQMWTAQYWEFMSPRTFITSGGLGTMGFGLGAAIGSKVAQPDKRVVLVTGDGSFRMNCNELVTVAHYKLPVAIVLLNNSTLGMVRQWQKMFQDERYSETCIENDVDYQKLAGAYGIKSFKVNSMVELESCLGDEALFNEPVFIEVIVDKDRNVIPIVPPGKAIDKLILG